MHIIKKPEYGLTLIEVMLTTAILSMGLLAVANMQIVSMHVNTASQRLTKATMITQEQMEELLTLPFDHWSLIDDTPPGIYSTYPAQNSPEGYIVRWEVDTNTNNTKTIKVVTSWVTDIGQKSISFPMQLSEYSNKEINPAPNS